MGTVKLHHSYEISYPQKGRAVAVEFSSIHIGDARAFGEQTPE